MATTGSNRQPKYRFAGFSLDAERGAVLHAGREVKLRPKVYDALRYFVENRGRLIAKEELIQALWPDAFVTEDSLVQCLVELRRALDDRDQEILKTVPRRGYIFAAEVSAGEEPSEPLPEPGEPALERVAGRYYLPLPRTPLIGRERELRAVKHLLLDPTIRMVTLTGAGGSGKTRLGLQVAAELVAQFESRVYFVALASITDPEMVAPAIAESIGIRQTGGRSYSEILREHFREVAPSPVLLLLDNFEHILAASPLVTELLEASGALKVLVTSRAALRVYGEHEFPVPPLALPESRQLHSPEALLRSPAVALFAQRAAAVKPDFTVTAENAAAVAEICSRVDGLPLAIELAAARVKMLSPNAMLARLQSRLQLLTAGARDLPERQQTLRKTIDWSYDLLKEAEQKLLRRLGVFLGGCTLEAAEAVADTHADLGAVTFDVMASLVDKSLILQTEHGSNEPRFAMLETIREYCLERLSESGEAATVRRAHAAYCLVLAEEGNPELDEAGRAAWLARCDIEHDNFRAALDWLFHTGDLDWAFRLCVSLFRFWDMREHLAEARARLETALRLSGSEYARERGKVSQYLSAITTTLGDFPAATRYAEQSLSIYRSLGDQWGIAVSMNACAIIARDRGDYAASQRYLEESLSFWRDLGDRVAVARCLYNLANLVKSRGDFTRARAVLEEAARIFADLGDRSGAAWSLSQQGDIALEQGDAAAARDLYQDALAAFRHAGDRWGIARSLTDLGYVACDQGDFVTAHAAYREGLDIFASLEHKRGIARALEGFACSAWARGDAARALVIAAAAAHLRHSIGAPLLPLGRVKFDQSLQAARDALKKPESQAAWERGWAMPLEAALQYARDDPGSTTSV
ncbi:MAG TPA: tetratricopeptide repeat protein [Bryobacteraceae bacterium]|nr:tetratricopeptide repeat protein [Bryobacteraceae bacterium]